VSLGGVKMIDWLRFGFLSRGKELETQPESRPENFRHCRVIAVSNQKGGTFKTGWTICYSRLFSDSPRTYAIYGRYPKVAIVGMDPACGVERAFGLADSMLERIKNTSLPAVLHHPDVDGLRPLPTHRIVQRFQNIHLYPATPGLSAYDSLMEVLAAQHRADVDAAELKRAEATSSRLRETRLLLKRFVDAIRDQYDRILIDSKPGEGELNLATLLAADWVHIPTLLSDASITQARRRADLVTEAAKMNPGLQIMAVIPTNLHKGNPRQRLWLAELSRKPSTPMKPDLSGWVVSPIWYNAHIDTIVENAHSRVYRRPLQQAVGVAFDQVLRMEGAYDRR